MAQCSVFNISPWFEVKNSRYAKVALSRVKNSKGNGVVRIIPYILKYSAMHRPSALSVVLHISFHPSFVMYVYIRSRAYLEFKEGIIEGI